ncbi:hypothetical protein [Trinickia mobilis]|uniref:hypothetical protein n=1 Tax=Trinickia mobilis TaxID=2816356 RepID=UPI001A8BFD0B|nr:hypothetical protein [Trinickia mobilis]
MGQVHSEGHELAHDREVQAQLCAYNTAFAELGLRFRWDAQTLISLAAIDGEQARITAYIQDHHKHLLHAYSAEFLSRAILEKKTARMPQCLPTLAGAAATGSRAANVPQAISPATRVSGDLSLPALVGA